MSNAVTKWRDDQLIPVRQKSNDEVEFSPEQLEEYAEHIGLSKDDISTHQELLVLAYEGLTTPLPEDWQACITPEGNDDIVYRNKNTREVFYEHPIDNTFRQKAQQLKRKLLQELSEGSIVGSSEGSVIKEQLSEIEEDENQFKNESEVYQKRGRYNPPLASRKMLRKSINKQDFKQLIEADINEVRNSVLDRNISSKDTGSFLQVKSDNRLLPSSLLKEVPVLALQEGLQQYKTVMTHHDRYQSESRSSEISKEDEEDKLRLKQRQLQEVQRQLVLKTALLKQLRESNQSKMGKLKLRLKRGR